MILQERHEEGKALFNAFRQTTDRQFGKIKKKVVLFQRKSGAGPKNHPGRSFSGLLFPDIEEEKRDDTAGCTRVQPNGGAAGGWVRP